MKRIKIKTDFTEGNKIIFDDDMVLYAFRYCLGRKTYVVSDMVEKIADIWHLLQANTKHVIKEDIRKAIKYNQAGHAIDVEQWEKILNL